MKILAVGKGELLLIHRDIVPLIVVIYGLDHNL